MFFSQIKVYLRGILATSVAVELKLRSDFLFVLHNKTNSVQQESDYLSYYRNGKGYCASHRIHEEALDAAVQEYTEAMREQCAEELKKNAQMQKMWACPRRPHCVVAERNSKVGEGK